MPQLAPKRYVLANRPVPLAQIYTDPGYTAPMRAVRSLSFNSPYPDHLSSFVFAWDGGNKSETFLFTNSPTNNGNDITTKGALTVDEYAHEIWVALLGNFALAQDWDITYNVSGTQIDILLTSRYYSTYGNGSTTPSISPSPYLSGFTVSNGLNAVYSDNTSAVIEVYVERDYLTGGFARAYAASRRIFGTDTIVWDVATALRSFLKAVPPYWNQITTMPTHLRRFFVKSALELGTPIRKQKMNIYPDPGIDYRNYGHAILGGQDFQFWLENPSEFGDYQFLTRYPNFTGINKKKRLLKFSPEFLVWFNYTGPIEPSPPSISGVRLYSQVTDTNNITHTPVLHLTKATVPGDLLALPVGYNQLGMASAYPGMAIKEYSIQLFDNTDSFLLAEERFYKIYNGDLSDSTVVRNWASVIHLVFLNNVGGWDTLICTDNFDHEFEVDQELTQQWVQPFYNVHEASEQVSSVEFRETIKFRTLPLEDYELSWVMEMLQSKNIYFVDVTSNNTDVKRWREVGLINDEVQTVGPTNKYQYIPATLKRGTFRISNSKNNTRVIELEMQLPKGRVRYSNELP